MTTDKTKRVFLAIPVLMDMSILIEKQIHALSEEHADTMRFLNTKDYHITLHFLGDLPLAKVVDMVQWVDPVIQSHAGFALQFEKLQCFPESHPHCWILTVKNSPALYALQASIGDCLSSHQLRIDSKAYFPHVTIAKKNRASAMPEIVLPTIQLPSLPVRRVLIYTSQLTSGTARYSPLDYFHLYCARP